MREKVYYSGLRNGEGRWERIYPTEVCFRKERRNKEIATSMYFYEFL